MEMSLSLTQCPMGEFKVHRVRFFDYMPSAIRAMAFNRQMERLAVARADGAVEIFNFADNYFQEKVRAHVAGGEDGSFLNLTSSSLSGDSWAERASCGGSLLGVWPPVQRRFGRGHHGVRPGEPEAPLQHGCLRGADLDPEQQQPGDAAGGGWTLSH